MDGGGMRSSGKEKDPSRVSGGAGRAVVRGQAQAPAPLARQDHQAVCGEGVIAASR